MNLKKYFVNLLDKFQPKPDHPIVEAVEDVKHPIEPSCVVKGLLKMLAENHDSWKDGRCKITGAFTLSTIVYGTSVVIGQEFFDKYTWVMVDSYLVDITREEKALIHDAVNAWREKLKAERVEAERKKAAPVIEKISKLGCPDR